MGSARRSARGRQDRPATRRSSACACTARAGRPSGRGCPDASRRAFGRCYHPPKRRRGTETMQITAQQLAELLLGIARAQAAIVQGLENEMAGVRSGRIIPALQNVAHLRDHPNPTLTDLPVRVLLGTLGRAVPDVAGIVRDLERLLPGDEAAAAPAENLDFSSPKPAG